ncbi:hypothetical protein HYDPIDRAFT_99131 [Hydnomerulius pinastri MD-312]|uniref:Unplaced genomic scaffold scaffold_40, whole genome shotgun sequence n=1 Tax=Hydnomerulius pinastri MD-312 TaxID=994086 RepID=A0A0C9V4D7_9AGAM|nr:hypothetical protein HYDPIDRAFT_99131 [Hydnomerulius pinastri MD-312]
MPHKRAKRSVREREKAERGSDLAPKASIEYETVPKSVLRVLDAGRIRREYREKKRKIDGDNDEGNPQRKRRRHDATDMKDDGTTKTLKIKPGETMAAFSKRVETSMMPLLKTALQESSAQARKVRKEEAIQVAQTPNKKNDKSRLKQPATSKKASTPPPTASADEDSLNPQKKAKEFQVVSTAAPRRLNDVAQEPPELKKLPRGAVKNDRSPSGVLSMAQKAMMEEEREKAIKHYRELKARKLRGDGVAQFGSVEGDNAAGLS